MSEERNLNLETVRAAAQALGQDGKEISHGLIYDYLGIDDESGKEIVRARVSNMVKHGEVTRTERGAFVYNFRHRPRNAAMLESVWRFVRAAKPGWTIEECSLLTRTSYSHTSRYVSWLEAEGFIERQGRNPDNRITFRNTGKARAHPETPYPPIRPTDPFARERMAAATITRLMLCADPYAVKTGRDICEACRVLLARFEKGNTESRTINENETKTEECHVE